MTTIIESSCTAISNASRQCLFIGVVLLLMAGRASAQGSAAGTTPPSLTPGLPAGSYALSGFESVNLFNGNLNFHLPLLNVGGRGGAQIPLLLKIEERWRVESSVNCGSCTPIFYPSYNWWTQYKPGYGPGIMEGRAVTWGSRLCPNLETEIPETSLIRLTFTSSDGTEYELRDQLTGGAPQAVPDFPCPPQHWFQRGTVFETADGSSATFFSCTPDGTPIPLFDEDAGFFYVSGVLLLRDGMRYRIDNNVVSWMQDRNGNRIRFFYDTTDPQGHPDGRVTRIIDSLNRQITISYDVNAGQPYGICDQISFQGFQGFNRTIRISKDMMGNVLRPGFVKHSTQYLFPTLSGSDATPFDTTVISAVWLPDGRSYKFYYNDYGELSRLVLPTGGAIEYDWGVGMNNSPVGGVVGNGQIYRRVRERRMYPDGASGSSFASKETYSVPETYVNSGPPPNAGFVAVKQFDSNLNLLTSSKHYFNGSAVYNPNEDSGYSDYSPWNSGKEYKTEAMDTDDFTVFQQADHTFDQTAPLWWNPPSSCTSCIAPSNNPRTTQDRTTWVQTNQVAQQSYSYDQYNNKTVIQEFDYGTGVPPQYPTRWTEIDYVTTGEINGIDYTGSNIASNVNSLPYMRSLPREQRVLSVSSTGATTVTSKTHFYYDQSALTDRPSITGWQTPVTAGRGNLTSTSRWLDATGGWITTSQTYDIAGQVVQTTDAKGNTSLIDFANSLNTYAYPTSLNTPVPDPTGQRGLTARLETIVAYDFASGLVTSITDPNGQVTTAGYNDLLDRLTLVTRPAGGSTTYVYGDAIGNLYLRTLTTQDSTQTLTVDQMFDGMGRAVETRTYEPGGGYISSKQTFDGIGRVVQTSNPFRPASESPAWTTTGYDALGTVRSVTTPDQAVVNTIYSGNMVMVTDQLQRRASLK